jgi:hypothetical protein
MNTKLKKNILPKQAEFKVLIPLPLSILFLHIQYQNNLHTAVNIKDTIKQETQNKINSKSLSSVEKQKVDECLAIYQTDEVLKCILSIGIDKLKDVAVQIYQSYIALK